MIEIQDGDSAILSDGNIQFTLRFAGMDTPELDQSYGEEAKEQLVKLIGEHRLQVQTIGKGYDKYGRVLGMAYIENLDLSLEMIKTGFAHYYRPGCRDYPECKDACQYDALPYFEAENQARESKLAIWSQDEVMLPCRYRRTHRGKWSQRS